MVGVQILTNLPSTFHLSLPQLKCQKIDICKYEAFLQRSVVEEFNEEERIWDRGLLKRINTKLPYFPGYKSHLSISRTLNFDTVHIKLLVG